MVLPVPAAIPDSTLTPAQARAKIQRLQFPALSALGAQVCDESGCYDDGSGSSVATLFPPTTQPVPTYTYEDLGTTTLNPSAPVANGGYFTSSGAIVITRNDGTWSYINPDGSSASGSGSPPMATAGTVTPQQASAWPAAIAALANAGVRIATITNLPAGASLLPNGTIVGSGQSLVRGGLVGGIGGSIASVFSNPTFLILALAAVVMVTEAR